jgi:hypothetical protein
MATNNPVIDAYNNRPDVQAMIKTKAGDAFTAGTEANTALNDWWNTTGNAETNKTNVITPASLQPTAEMKTLTPSDGMDYYNKVFNDAIAGFGDTQQAVNDNTAKTQGQVDEVASLSDILLGKTADTAAANETAGVNAERATNTNLTNQLNDTTAQINALARQAQAIPMQTQQEGEKRIMTDAGAAPITAAGLRENAIKALTLGQQSDILNASLTNSSNRLIDAKDKAQQIIDLKYKPIEDKIKNLQDQLEMNKTYITDPAEKKLAEQQKIILDERTAKIADEKEKERIAAEQKIADTQSINNIALEAAKNGASQDIINAISGATDVRGAIMAAGASLQSPNTQIITLEDGNTVLVDSKNGNVIKNFGGAKPYQASVSEQLGAAAAGYNIDSKGNITTSATISIPASTLAGKNNNPGNLRFVGQAGATQGQGGFARFASPEAGYQALLNQISLDASRGLTVSQFVNKYAPPSENNTGQYISQFTAKLGCSSSTKLSTLDLGAVGEFMAMKESGTKITSAPTVSTATNDTVTNWAKNIKAGVAKLSDVPDNMKSAVSTAMQSEDIAADKPAPTEMGTKALETAKSLLDKLYKSDWNTNAVGKSSILGGAKIPGSASANLANDFNSLKAQLSMDSVKLLKGQGAVSDAERALLAQSVTKLSLNQSDQEFHDTLQGIIRTLTGTSAGQTTSYKGIYLPGSVNTDLSVFKGVSLPN